jgi:hypothetical protein
LSACGTDSPVAPTPTKIIRLGGNLNFGAVPINTVRSDGLLTVSNDGTATLHVSGIAGPCPSAFSVLGSTTFDVGSKQTVNLGIKFAPTSVMSCSGSVTVTSDATSGTNVIGIDASGVG